MHGAHLSWGKGDAPYQKGRGKAPTSVCCGVKLRCWKTECKEEGDRRWSPSSLLAQG